MGMPRTYIRPMGSWWRRLPYYRRYMVREATCIAVIAYALVLLVGLWRLTQGREAFDAWRVALATPASLLAHGVLLAAFVFHAWTWFEVMPKTLPILRVGGKRVADATIVRSGAAAAVVASVLLLALAYGGWR
ncbi:MAG: fumarate reductase subunit C [Chromatiales bacterium]|jgi:fumarate reductase subunit C|nr:MAG: fumarate reductase subunit C [Chromatiales bacterium]